MKLDRKPNIKVVDPWESLNAYTNARIALGAVGSSIPNEEVMKLKLAHANAKDAIATELDVLNLEQELRKFALPIFTVSSQVTSREVYLKRPDLGRRLNNDSVSELNKANGPFDFLFVLADGLSAEAVNMQSVPLVEQSISMLSSNDLKAGVVLAKYARVALGDEIGQLLNARFVALFIGERPGLSSPVSMGVYTTFAPKIGLTDERRNCISNIHTNGLSIFQAARILQHLYEQSINKKISGVEIKLDLSESLSVTLNQKIDNTN
ncbi:MAG: ethanolamine ammonia-lyase subunit EutC [Bacteroidota bacterium]